MSAQKCVHRGCEKTYTDPEESCLYHPGPPVFHEGQKGWKCCKPRVLTFDEFMSIEPCTTGKHSTTDLPPAVEKPQHDESATAKLQQESQPSAALPSRAPIAAPTAPTTSSSAPPELSDSDDSTLKIPDGRICRRKTCGVAFKEGASREGEKCVFHPGAPIFHEGSKGYSCCKRRVLEFDEFMRIEGCKTKERHLFVGSGKKEKKGEEEELETVRHDFYQTVTQVHASFFLKKINKDTASISFSNATTLSLNLPTTDTPPKRFKQDIELFGKINTESSTFKIMGTKLEVTLVKDDGASWPVLKAGENHSGEIIQVGRAGRA